MMIIDTKQIVLIILFSISNYPTNGKNNPIVLTKNSHLKKLKVLSNWKSIIYLIAFCLRIKSSLASTMLLISSAR